MTRLLLDHIRRSWNSYAGGAAFMALIYVLPPDYFPVQWGRWIVSWSLVIAYTMGPGPSFKSSKMRELALLPVSWRDRWRTQWLLAVMAPLIVIALGQGLGWIIVAAAELPARNADIIPLSLLCAAAYVGFCSGLQLLFRRRSGRPAGRPPGPAATSSERLRRVITFWLMFTVIFVVVTGGAFAGFLLYPIVPTTFAALRGVTGGIIAVGIATGLWTWFQWSMLGPRPSLFQAPLRAPSPGTPSPLPRDSHRTGGASSLFRLAVKRACVAALMSGAVMAPIFWFATNDDFVKCLWIAVVFLAGSADWHQHLRPLRVLPVTTARLNLAILSNPVTLWLATWFLLKIAALVVPTRIDALMTLPAATLMAGMGAVGVSVRLPRSRIVATLMGAVFGLPLGLVYAWRAFPSLPLWPVIIAAAGLALLAVAAALNHFILTRSSTVYRPQPALASPLGVPLQR